MQSHFTLIDWIVLVVYFCGTMGIGIYFYRKSRTTEGFTAADRSVPGWAVGLSIFATYLSSISFLALPGKAYATNWNPFVFSLSLPIATWIAVRFFMPYYRKSGEVSAYFNLEHRFGPWARIYTSIFFLLTQLARFGAVTYLMALPMSILFGWDIRLIIIITSLSVICYAFIGGILAVIWTDAFQAIVLTVGTLICAGVVMFGTQGGPKEMFNIAIQHNKFSLGSFGGSLTQSTFWVVLIYGIVMNLQNFGIDQNFVQRYIVAKSDKEAKKSVWLGGLLYVPISLLFFFIGTGLFTYYQTHPQELLEVKTAAAMQKLSNDGIAQDSPDYHQKLEAVRQTLSDADIGDKVFPYFIGTKLPSGITGLLIAAIFAAAMSTTASCLNASATLLLTDFYKRYFHKNATEKESMGFLYASTCIWGILGMGVALLLIRVTSALDAWWILSGIFGGGMLGLFLLGLISRCAGNVSAITATLFGILVILWMSLSQGILAFISKYKCFSGWANLLKNLPTDLHLFLVPVFGTTTILFVGLLLSSLLKSNNPGKDTTND
jgi:SSS family solute:Na+ symporter